jgi:hypothetical protein
MNLPAPEKKTRTSGSLILNFLKNWNCQLYKRQITAQHWLCVESFWDFLLGWWSCGFGLACRYVYSSDPDEKVQPTVSEITMKLTKDLNMNVSVANINLFLEAYASWTSLSKLEQGSSKQQFLQV